MSVVIRMKRTGRRNRPCYRISVADSRLPRDGRTLDTLGLYDPIAATEERRLSLDVERAKHWVSKGAKPSDTVWSIFKRAGVFEGFAPKKPRKRSGRYKQTASKARRKAEKAGVLERKEARRNERVASKKAAASAAASEGSAAE